MSDEDDLQQTQMEQAAVEAGEDHGDDLMDTVVTGMPAFKLPPELAEAAAEGDDDEEPGPEDTDETVAGDLDDDGDGGDAPADAGDADDADDADDPDDGTLP